MAHEVIMGIDTKFVLHKDVEVKVKSNNKSLGTLLISKGNVEWVPSGAHVNKVRLSWKKFATLIESEGKPVKIRKPAAKKAAPKAAQKVAAPK